jgi:citrate lyase subunit beta/citryl-CoA lyase
VSLIDAACTFLFVPGDRPERFDKAVAARADIVVIDLEDAVAPGAKAAARATVARWLRTGQPVMLRVNACGTPWFEEDLKIAQHDGVLGIMLPKAEAGPATKRVAKLVPTVALVETARGVAIMTRLDGRNSGVRRLALGDIDLALDLGLGSNGAILDPIRLQMVVASRVLHLAPPIAGVTVNTVDMEVVRDDAERARSGGFSGKLAIHPRQVAAILAGFRPGAGEIARAKTIVEADRAAGGSAVSLNGQMIDKPLVERARRLLASIAGA